MRYNKKLYLFLFVTMLVSLSFFIVGCSNSSKNISASKLNSVPVVRLDGSYSIDVNNPIESVGDADNVFLARVDQQVNTEYRNPVTIKNGTKTITSPYTNYKVTVLKNIKGKLQTDTSIPITKAGGVSEDSSSVVLYDDDALPEVGKLYVFIAYTQEDGSLLITGPKSNILVGISNKIETSGKLPPELATSSIVSQYEKAKVNQKIVRERKRFVSKFDVNK